MLFKVILSHAMRILERLIRSWTVVAPELAGPAAKLQERTRARNFK